MLIRLIIALLVIAAIFALMRKLREKAAAKPPALDQKTVRCAHCEVYLPRGEAVQAGDEFFCSSEHAEAHR